MRRGRLGSMPESGLDAAAQSLRAWLNREHFTDLSATEATKFFTNSIATWANSLGYRIEREKHLPANDQRPDRHPGRIDLRATHRSGRGRAMSIEIDRSNKLWSLDKLTQAAELGDLALWVRWSAAPIHIPIPPAVRLIRAQVIRRETASAGTRYSLQAERCD